MKNEIEDGTLLGTFTYDEYGEPTQTFELPVSQNCFMDDLFILQILNVLIFFWLFHFLLSGRRFPHQLQQPTDEVYRLVELRVLSNWGHMEYTCLYRFRVHGQISKWNQMDNPLFADSSIFFNSKIVYSIGWWKAYFPIKQMLLSIAFPVCILYLRLN